MLLVGIFLGKVAVFVIVLLYPTATLAPAVYPFVTDNLTVAHVTALTLKKMSLVRIRNGDDVIVFLGNGLTAIGAGKGMGVTVIGVGVSFRLVEVGARIGVARIVGRTVAFGARGAGIVWQIRRIGIRGYRRGTVGLIRLILAETADQ